MAEHEQLHVAAELMWTATGDTLAACRVILFGSAPAGVSSFICPRDTTCPGPNRTRCSSCTTDRTSPTRATKRRAGRGTPTRRSTGSSPTAASRPSSWSGSITPARNGSASSPRPCRTMAAARHRVRPLDRRSPHPRFGRRPQYPHRRPRRDARRLVARRSGHALDRVDVTRPVRPADGDVALGLVGQPRDPAPPARSAASTRPRASGSTSARTRANPSSATRARSAICSASSATSSCATSKIPTAITPRRAGDAGSRTRWCGCTRRDCASIELAIGSIDRFRRVQTSGHAISVARSWCPAVNLIDKSID